MLVVMKAHASAEEVRAVCEKIESLGYRAHSIPGAERTAIGITGNKGEIEPGTLDEMTGVQEVIRVTKPYKLVSRDMKDDNTVVSFPGTDATFGGPGLAIVAGPCAIESREQAFAIAERVHRSGAQFFRGGAYKPRTSPEELRSRAMHALRYRKCLFAALDGAWPGNDCETRPAKSRVSAGKGDDGVVILHVATDQLVR